MLNVYKLESGTAIPIQGPKCSAKRRYKVYAMNGSVADFGAAHQIVHHRASAANSLPGKHGERPGGWIEPTDQAKDLFYLVLEQT